jgi:GNAT superfamily N-acetyltransferase
VPSHHFRLPTLFVTDSDNAWSARPENAALLYQNDTFARTRLVVGKLHSQASGGSHLVRHAQGGGMHLAKPDLVESVHHFITIWKLIGKPFPEVDGTDMPGLAISWPNTQFPFYNSLFLSEHVTDARVLQDRVQEASAYMHARPNRGVFVVCLDNLSGSAKNNLDVILARSKFVQAIPMTGMAGDILPMEAPGHSALRFVRISDDSTIRVFAELNCVSYGVPIETSLSLVKEHTLWQEHAYGFVAYEGNKPVSTATAIINEGCLYLFLVATSPDARRKGYGEAVVRYALQRAHEATGIRRTVLHATEDGHPIYLRLGYRPTGKFMGCMLEF